MVAIFSGYQTGLNLSSIATLGRRGVFGAATQGRNGEGAYVNVASGNLVLQDQDMALVGLGLDTGAARTYNSLGAYDFDGNLDAWQGAPTRAIARVDATTLRLYEADGSALDYTGSDAAGYTAKQAFGSALDRIVVNGDGTYTWTDGATAKTETYQAGAFGRITSARDPSGNSLTFLYDASNLLTKVTDANGETVNFTYAGRNLQSVTTKQSNGTVLNSVAYTYDAQNRLKTVSVTVGTGNTYVTTYAYQDTSNRLSSVTQSDGSSLGFTYVLVNGAYRIATATDGEGKTTSFSYDVAGLKTTVTDPLGVKTIYQYKATTGLLEKVTAGVTPTTPDGQSSLVYTYDTLGDVLTITDGLGRVTTMTYVNGNLMTQVDGAGNRLERTYDARNQLLTETVFAGAGATQPETTRYVYDSGNKCLLRFVVSAEGRVTEYRYSSTGLRTRSIEYLEGAYTAAGIPDEVAMSLWANDLPKLTASVTDLAYDFRGELQSLTRWDKVQWNATTQAWDGVLTSGTTYTKYVRDARGLLLETLTLALATLTPTPSGTTLSQTVYTYDGMGRVLTTTTTGSAGETLSSTVTAYDDPSRRTVVTLVNGLATTSTYDRAGRLISVAQASGATGLGTTAYSYDSAGRLIRTADPSGARSWSFYDALGRKVADVDGAGGVKEYAYDPDGQLTQVIGYASRNTSSGTWQVSNGTVVTVELDEFYEPFEVPITLDMVRPVATAADEKSWKLYDAAGRLAWEVDALGYVTQTQYDGASRVISTTRLANPIDTSTLGSGVGVRLALSGLASTTTLTDTALGSGKAGLHQLTATVVGQAGATLTGAVVFYNGSTCLGAATVAGGSATLTTALPAGANSLTAVYSGDAGTVGSASAAVISTVVAQGATTTALQVSADRISLGEAVTITVTVAGADPTGSVTIYGAGATPAVVALINGVGTLTTSALTAGQAALTALYSGDAANATSGSSVVNVRVVQATTVALSATRASASDPVILAATMGAPGATGTVTFMQGTTVLGSSSISGGLATLSLPALAGGTVKAVYSGDAGYAAATSSDVSTSALLAPTTVTLAVPSTQVTAGQNLTLTATVQGSASPTGTVTFYSGAAVLGTGTLNAGGQAALTVSGFAMSAGNLTATYTGDIRNAPSASSATAVTVTRQVATVTLACSSASSTHGQAVTLTATVGSGSYAATGTVTFLKGNVVLGTATVSGGQAVLTLSNLAVGANAITATYSGDSKAASAVSANVTHSVAISPTTVTLTTSPTWVAAGTAVTLTAAVSGSATKLATGTVTFFNGASSLGQGTLTNGVATLVLTTLPAGGLPITASYGGDSYNAASTSAVVNQNVTATTPILVTSSAGSVQQGTAFTLTATVRAGAYPLDVTFYNGTTVLGVAQVNSATWKATLTTAIYSTGTASIRADSSGDYAWSLSQSAAVAVTVTAKTPAPTAPTPPPATTTTLTMQQSATIGSNGYLQASVTPTAGQPLPTGTVSFFTGSTLIGSGTLSGGVATLCYFTTFINNLPVGTYAVTAVYSGDASNAASVSAAGTISVNKATSSVTLRPAASQTTAGASLALVAQVNGYAPGGTVTFFNGATAIGSPVAIVNGLATLSVTSLPVGLASLTAVYAGDGNNTGATSAAAAVTVVPVRTSSSVSLTASPATVQKGQPLTLTATVTGASPTGAVSFFNGSSLIGSATLAGTSAQLVVANLPLNVNNITAVYSGDATNASSISVNLAQNVVAASTTTTLTSSKAQTSYGEAITLTATVAGSGGATGTVTFMRAGVSIGGPVTLINGVATLTTSTLGVGTASLTASYNGDAGNTISTSGVASVTVGKLTTRTTMVMPPSPQPMDAALTVTAGVTATGYTPAGTVTFLRGTTVLGTVTLAGGFATLQLQGLSGGTENITASYSGDALAESSVSWGSLTVTPAQASMQLAASASTVALGRPVTLTATVTGASPSGTVTFFNGDTLLGTTVPLVDGIAALTVGNLPPGELSIRATYSGDANNLPCGAVELLPLTVTTPPAVSTVAGMQAYASGEWGVVVTTTVTGKAPSGYLTYLDGQTVLGFARVGADGSVSSSLRVAAAPTGPLTTIFTGDSGGGWATSQSTVGVSQYWFPPALVGLPTTASQTTLVASAATTAGDQFTLTATVNTLSGGVVLFYDGSSLLGSSTVVDGRAVLNVSGLALASHTFKAVFAGLSAAPSSAISTPMSATKAFTDVTILAAWPSTTPGRATVVARVGGVGATGVVTFKQGPTVLASRPVIDGIAYGDIVGVGAMSITAEYGGDALNKTSTSPAFAVTIPSSKASTTASLLASPATSVFGSPVTLTATMSGTTPSGTVTFFAGTTPLGSAVVSGTTASLTVTSLPVGANSITAVYSGNATYRSAVSVPVTATVQVVATTTTTLATAAASANYGSPVSLTATVSGATNPSGVVTFKNGSTALGTAAVVGGVATLSVSTLPVGTWSLTAEYGCDTGNAASVSGALSQTINRAVATLSRTSAVSIAVGQAITVSVAGSQPTGVVTLLSGTTVLGTAQVVNGAATFLAPYVPVGTTTLHATYSGDAFNGTSVVQFSQTIIPTASSTVLTATTSGAVSQGAAVRLMARVTGGQPSGIVTFKFGATVLGTATLVNGVAAITTTALPKGVDGLTAVYGGDARNSGSTSAVVLETVLAPPATVLLSASASTVTQGASVTFTATVTGASPTGQVTFVSGATVVGVASVVSGTASLTVSQILLPAGAASVVAVYGGDAANGGARSSAVVETVNAGIRTLRAGASEASDRVITRFLDRDGRLTATIDGEGYLTEYQYDANGRLAGTVAYYNPLPGFTGAASIAAAVAAARTSHSLTGLGLTLDANARDVRTYIAYDPQGRKTRELDGEKFLTEWKYDATGKVSSVRRYATPVTVTVTSSAQLAAVSPATNSEDQTQSYVYDGLGRVVQETNAENTVTKYEYDGVGNLSWKRVALGETNQRNVNLKYDVQGRLTDEIAPGGATVHHTYDAAGLRTSTTDAAGNRTLFFYDDAGLLRYTVNALGEVTANDYDGLGRSTVTTRTRIPTSINLATWQGGRLSASPVAASVLPAYQASGESCAVSPLDGLNMTTRRTYDAGGRVVVETMAGTQRKTTTEYDAFGAAVKVTQAIDATRGTSSTSIYDRRGLRTDAYADAGGINARSQVKYDAFGRAWEVTEPSGLVRTMAFDRLGRTIQVSDFTGSRRTTYDAFGRVLRELAPAQAAKLTGNQANDDLVWNTCSTQYTYENLGKAQAGLSAGKVIVRTPEGVQVETVRDRHGQVLTIKDGNGITTSYGYDIDGRLLTRAVTGADGVTTTDRTSYLGKSNLVDTTWTTRSDSSQEFSEVRYTYDAANRVVSRRIDPDGLNLTTQYVFDSKGRQIKEVAPNGFITTTTYDRAGDVVTRVFDPSVTHTVQVWDPDNEVYITETVFDYAGLDLTTTYTHDALGQVLTVQGPGGKTQYTYDALGRRTDTIVDPGAGKLNLKTTYQYDASGNVVASWDPNLNLTRYVYDAANRLVYTVDATGGVVKNDYDAGGRVTATTTYAQALSPAGLTGLATTATVADVLAALGARGTPPAGLSPDAIQRNVYDKSGRLHFTVDGAGGVTRLTYDGNGNVVERRTFAKTIILANWDKVSDPVVLESGPADVLQDLRTRTVYDALNRAIYTVDGTGAVVAQKYDGAGNVVDRRAYATRLTGLRSDSRLALTDFENATTHACLVPEATADAHTRRIYDGAGRLTWSVDGVGAVTKQEFDTAGNLLKVIQYARTVGPSETPTTALAGQGDRVTVMGYDAANRRVVQVDPLGWVTRVFYDAAGNVVAKVAFKSTTFEPLTASTDAATTSSAPLLWSITGPDADPDNRISRAFFDAANRLVYSIDATGAVVKYTYDAAGNTIATTAYAKALTSGLPSFGSAPSTVAPQLDPTNDRTTLSAYDAAGRMVFTVDALGHIGKSMYDGAGRVKNTIRYATPKPSLAVGASAAAIQDAVQEAPSLDRPASYTFDAAGRTLIVTDALGFTEAYEYDGVGNKIKFTNKLNNVWTYAYDAVGRLLTETAPQVTQRLAASDGSLLATPTLAPPVVTTLGYDALGNLTSRTEATGLVGLERTTRYAYDAVGRQVRTELPAVSIYKPTADPSGLKTVSDLRTAVETGPVVLSTDVTYDAFGDAVANRDVSGNWSYKVYDRAGRLTYDVDAEGYVTAQVRNAFGDVETLTRYATRSTLNMNTGVVPTAAAVSDALATSDVDRTLTTTYDKLGRTETVTQPAVWVNDGKEWSGLSSPTTTTAYNAFGEVIQVSQKVSDVLWSTTTHYFDRLGRESETVDAGGYLTRLRYDAVGNLTERIEFAKALAGWNPAAYATASLTVDEGDLDNRRTTFTYDLNDRKKSETRWGVEFSETATGTSARGQVTTDYDYDALGNLVWTRDPMGAETRTYYDVLGRTEAVLEPGRSIEGVAGIRSPLTVFLRDAHGNVVAKREFARGASAASAVGWTADVDAVNDRITRTIFDARGNAIESIDALLLHKYTSYDAAGQVVKMWQGVDWNPGTLAYKRTQFRVFAYDKLGRQVEVISPASTQGYDSLTGVWSTLTQASAGTIREVAKYNAFGELEEKYKVKTGSEPIERETFEYDKAGRLWRSNSGDGVYKAYLYDLAGRQTTVLASLGAATWVGDYLFGHSVGDLGDKSYFTDARFVDQSTTLPLRRTSTELDVLGRAIKTTLPARKDVQDAAAYRPVIVQTYDRWGNVLTQSDPRNTGWLTTFRYNANNQLVEQRQPDGEGGQSVNSPVTKIYYDRVGRQVAIRDANGNVNGQEWDKAGQLVKETHADSGQVLRSYDAFGDQVAVRDAELHWTRYGFDKRGRNTRVETDPVDVYDVTWSNWGAVSKATRALVTTFTYDELDNKTVENNDTAPDKIFGWDLQGNLITSSNGRDRQTSAFDVWGHKVAELGAPTGAIGAPDTTGVRLLSTWTYDAFGQLRARRDVGGATYSYTYDFARQLTGLSSWVSGSPVQNLTYGYDAAGQLTRIFDATLQQESTFGYNAAGKKVLERVAQGGNTYQDQWLAYDTLGRLAQVNAFDGTSVHYDYDQAGNRLHQSVKYNTAAKNGATGTYTITAKAQELWYAYDSMNRAILVDGALNGDATDAANITSAQGHIVAYDFNGNRKLDRTWGTAVEVYTDEFGAPQYSEPEGQVYFSYEYDAAGRLVATKQAGVIVDVRNYDGASRVVRSGAVDTSDRDFVIAASKFDGTKIGTRISLSDYDEAGNLIAQHSDYLYGGQASDQSFQTQRTETRQVTKEEWSKPLQEWVEVTRTVTGTYYTSNYDDAGNLLEYTNSSGGVVTTNKNVYEDKGTHRLLKSTAVRSDNGNVTAVMANGYDANGFLTQVQASTVTNSTGAVSWDLAKTRSMVNDANGKVLFKNQNGDLMRQLVVDGNVVGLYGVGPNPKKPSDATLVAQGNFDLNYQPITSSFPSAAAGQYQVATGDTLQAIAQSAYGDASLWYVIADANGLRDDGDLRIGSTLSIPTRAAGAVNKAGTYGAYDPSKIVGDTSPEAPAPPAPKQKCSGAARIWATILVVVVAVVVSALTYGAASMLLGPATGWGLGATVAVGATAAAASSAASQLVSWGVGLTDGFSWKQVGMAALGGAITAGVGWGMDAGLKELGVTVQKLEGIQLYGLNAAKAMVSSAITQQAQTVIWRNHKNFSWGEVANAGLNSVLNTAAGKGEAEIRDGGLGGEVQRMAYKTITGFETNLIMAGVRGGEAQPMSILADSFGNALGNSIGQALASKMPVALSRERVATPRKDDPVEALAVVYERQLGVDRATALRQAAEKVEDFKKNGLADLWAMGGNEAGEEWKPTTLAQRRAYSAALEQTGSVESASSMARMVASKEYFDDALARLGQYSKTDPEFASAITQLKPVLDYALLSADAYNKTSIPELLPKGYRRLTSEEELGAVGLKPSALADEASGYFAALYQRWDGGYVLANRGTEGFPGSGNPEGNKDWIANFEQGAGRGSRQHELAIRAAKTLAANAGDVDITFTGHSLGGGLAMTQALATDRHATVFNAAAVHHDTLLHYGYTPQEVDLKFSRAGALIDAYHVRGEVLNTLQDGGKYAIGILAASGAASFGWAGGEGGGGVGAGIGAGLAAKIWDLPAVQGSRQELLPVLPANWGADGPVGGKPLLDNQIVPNSGRLHYMTSVLDSLVTGLYQRTVFPNSLARRPAR